MKNSEIVNCFTEISVEGLLYIMAMARKTHVKRAVSLYITSLQDIEPSLSGKDLVAMGYSPGPRFKEILTFLRDARLDNQVKDADGEAALVKKTFPL